MSKQKNGSGKAVLVTTEHRGVFFGYEDERPDSTTIKLKNARNCLYWTADVKGFLGLAITGPSSGCRIGPQVSALELTKVTSIAEVSEAAAAAWEKAPWSR